MTLGPVAAATQTLALTLLTAVGLIGIAPNRTHAQPLAFPVSDWAFLDNGSIRLGAKLASGGGLAYLSASGSGRNLLNHFDRGRLIQQSYYGDPDGSRWGDIPWRWNPVQGGDWRGTPSTLLEVRATPDEIFTRTRPRNWAGCVDLPEVVMEQRVTLDGPVAHVRLRMDYHGARTHAEADHEIPAVFVEPDLTTLVLYDGDAPWTNGPLSRSKPGWPNEGRRMTEHWAAYVDASGFGIGIHVPIADRLTCYRYADGHTAAEGACSYLAPLTRFALTPGQSFRYDLDLTLGTPEQIRDRFRRLHDAPR